MKALLKIGKYSLQIGCILLLWAFLCILPLRSLAFSETFPAYFSVPFTEDLKWIFYVIGLAPLLVMGVPLFFLHKKYERWHKLQNEAEIQNHIKKFLNINIGRKLTIQHR